MRIFISVIIGIVMLSACEKPFDWTYDKSEERVPVVEGIITNENKIQEVFLSWTRSEPNKPSEPITNAMVNVQLGNTTYAFIHDNLQEGRYISQQAFIGVVNLNTSIEVIVDGNIFTGKDVMIPVSSTQKAAFKSINDTMSELQTSGFYSSEPAMWVLDIDWSFLPAYQQMPADSCKARVFYYDLTTLDVSQVFAPNRQNLFFPKGAGVSQLKYALSKDHETFRRSILLETEWRGGLFDVSPGAVYTNIKGGALGFFGACSVIRMNYLIE